MASLLGADYDSSSDDDTKSSAPKAAAPTTTATKVVAAPEVNTEVWSPVFYFVPFSSIFFYL